jgi:hypothetical protein
MLKERGPSADAFTFRKPFPPPGVDSRIEPLDAAFCEFAS